MNAVLILLAVLFLPPATSHRAPPVLGRFELPCGSFPSTYDPIKVLHSIIDDSCPFDGIHSSQTKLVENEEKNDFCIGGDPTSVTYDDLTALANPPRLTHLVTRQPTSLGEGTLVQYVAFVMEAHYADTSASGTAGRAGTAGEDVNCKRSSQAENDIHIALVPSLDPAADECTSTTAEMSPHYRPEIWTADNLNAIGHHPVRVTGPLFYDGIQHKPCQKSGSRWISRNPKRITSWEIHPVYEIEVCKSDSIADCTAGNRLAWTRLSQFANEAQPRRP